MKNKNLKKEKRKKKEDRKIWSDKEGIEEVPGVWLQ